MEFLNNRERERERERQQSQLRSQITTLEQKPQKTPSEQAELASKKKELAELLKKQNNSNTNAKPSDKTALYIGLGIVGVVLIGLVLIIVRNKKSKKY